MTISVLCPVLNEQKYIGALLDFLVPLSRNFNELVFIDGESSDMTKEIIQNYKRKYPNILLLSNQKRIVPVALNLAIPYCTGDIIVRIDAHCKYARDYFDQIISIFAKTGADIVGGPTRTGFENFRQQAVGYAISTPFGVGNSSVHQIDYNGETDSVTFGAWRRGVFGDCGLFDERLKRNQDDEFHYRCKSMGKKIYQSADIKLYYFPRDKIGALFRQYFEYGKYKPMVLLKIKSGTKWRHLVPSLFVIYLFILPFILLFGPIAVVPLLVYSAALLFFSLSNAMPLKSKMLTILIYPTIHMAYGLGFMRGLFSTGLRNS
jgi:succinoglycan biosynthesis protein ExoA